MIEGVVGHGVRLSPRRRPGKEGGEGERIMEAVLHFFLPHMWYNKVRRSHTNLEVPHMQTKTKVRSESKDVAEQLAELGLTADLLRTALEEGWRLAADCTKHDPPNLPGIIVWGKTIRHLRDALIPEGWRADNTMNYSTVVAPDKQTALAVAAGDECTGMDGVTPCTRSPKGPATRKALNRNQLTFANFAEHFPKPTRRRVMGTQRLTWLLLHCVDVERGEIRLELSLPSEMDEQGRIAEWRERILLQPIAHLPEAFTSMSVDDESADVEINIERKGV